MSLKIKKISGIYQLESETVIAAPINEVWAFFSRPENLDAITPQEMGFEITSAKGQTTFAGQIISYKIQIFPFIKSSWITEITHCADRRYFIDEQRFGPYSMWHHEHHFRDLGNKTTILDRVSYRLPLGAFGRLVAGKIIAQRVEKIFRYRNEKIKEFF